MTVERQMEGMWGQIVVRNTWRKARQLWRGMGGAKEDQPKRPSDRQMLET